MYAFRPLLIYGNLPHQISSTVEAPSVSKDQGLDSRTEALVPLLTSCPELGLSYGPSAEDILPSWYRRTPRRGNCRDLGRSGWCNWGWAALCHFRLERMIFPHAKVWGLAPPANFACCLYLFGPHCSTRSRFEKSGISKILS